MIDKKRIKSWLKDYDDHEEHDLDLTISLKDEAERIFREIVPVVPMDRPFRITSVCRDDVIQALALGMRKAKAEKIARSLTDEEMDWIARKLADDYCNQLFWDSLRIMAETVVSRRDHE